MPNPLSFLWGDKHPRVKVRRRRRKSKHGQGEDETPGVDAIEKLVVEEIEIADVGALRLATAAPAKKRRSSRSPALRAAFTWTALWLLPVLAALFARSPWPMDETRTLAVAWEMWTHGSGLVPSLNGELYTQQPPLLFWLINLGWRVLGVNEWWPRVLPALFGLASVYLTGRLARSLWPEEDNVRRYAPVLLMGMVFWAFYLTLSLADMLLVFFTMLGAIAIVAMWRQQRRYAWLLLGVSLGLGILSSGLGAIIFLAPVALLLPFWASASDRPHPGPWYADTMKAALLALLIAGAGLFAVASAGGTAYIDRLLANPLPAVPVDLFATARPWWWYLAALVVVTLPWSIFPLVWMRLGHISREKTNPGIAFCLFWAWPTILILSLFGLKQPQFLLPLLPAFALGMSYLLLAEDLKYVGGDSVFASMGFPIVVLGGILAAVPGLPRVEALPDMLWEQRSVFIGIAVAGVGMLLAWLPVPAMRQRIMNIAGGGIAILVIALLGVGSQFDQLYGTNQVAKYLANAQRQQRAIAHVGRYDGQFQFAGRLTAPLEVVAAAEAAKWCASHPDGLIVTYTEGWQPRAAARAQPVLEANFRDQRVRIWDARTIISVGS
jgi:4-amino-4-deoxy-L-arabinose transferase-like glycosyltransferase